jgi:hypothetical protein
MFGPIGRQSSIDREERLPVCRVSVRVGVCRSLPSEPHILLVGRHLLVCFVRMSRAFSTWLKVGKRTLLIDVLLELEGSHDEPDRTEEPDRLALASVELGHPGLLTGGGQWTIDDGGKDKRLLDTDSQISGVGG